MNWYVGTLPPSAVRGIRKADVIEVVDGAVLGAIRRGEPLRRTQIMERHRAGLRTLGYSNRQVSAYLRAVYTGVPDHLNGEKLDELSRSGCSDINLNRLVR